jgi:hypothetical protein
MPAIPCNFPFEYVPDHFASSQESEDKAIVERVKERGATDGDCVPRLSGNEGSDVREKECMIRQRQEGENCRKGKAKERTRGTETAALLGVRCGEETCEMRGRLTSARVLEVLARRSSCGGKREREVK